MTVAIVDKTVAFVKDTLASNDGGHDWWHIYRVWQLAKHIGEQEQANTLVVELAALLHDVADEKFTAGGDQQSTVLVAQHLQSCGLNQDLIDQVNYTVSNVSFRNSLAKRKKHTEPVELLIVQDADRLDALGAIGIARAFAYGGFRGRPLFDPTIKPQRFTSKKDYQNSAGPSLNHFYEKILLLKDGMHTKAGKQLAEQRHQFVEAYLAQFLAEWDCQR